MLTSPRQQHESAVGIRPFRPSLASLPPHPTPPGYHRAPDLSSLHHTVNFHWLSDFAYGDVHVSKRCLLCSTVSVATVRAPELSAGSGLRGGCHVEPLPASHHEGDTLDTRHIKGTGGTEDQRKRERCAPPTAKAPCRGGHLGRHGWGHVHTVIVHLPGRGLGAHPERSHRCGELGSPLECAG